MSVLLEVRVLIACAPTNAKTEASAPLEFASMLEFLIFFFFSLSPSFRDWIVFSFKALPWISFL
jgi:hypothetical protein